MVQSGAQSGTQATTQPAQHGPSPKGVLPGKEGVILQRGGEELLLYKVNNRLSLCLREPSALPALTAQWRPQKVRSVTPQAMATPAQGIAQSPVIFEWLLPARQLEEALAQLRNDAASAAGVLYASHVYELAMSPGTYVYLAHQLTVQFADGLPLTNIEAMARGVGLIRSHALNDGGSPMRPRCYWQSPTLLPLPRRYTALRIACMTSSGTYFIAAAIAT
jgi:hypothetical protein